MVVMRPFLFFIALWCITHAQNLFKNADFEGDFGSGNWFCNGCPTLQRSTDAHRGRYSARVTGRTANWHSLTQMVDLRQDGRYHFSLHIKLLNQGAGKMFHAVQLMMHTTFTDGSEDYTLIGLEPHFRQDQGWQKLGGDIKLKNKGIRSCRFYVQMRDLDINYLVDTASLTEINLSTYQQTGVDLGGINPRNTVVELRQTESAFPFGTAVKSFLLTDSTYKRYQDIYYENFNWAVLEYEMKWIPMERTRGNVNFGLADPGLAKLQQNGKKVRGHTLFWGKRDNVPTWLRSMSGQQVNSEADRRAEYCVNHFKGKVEHWDVNNEQLHGTFFEDKTGNVGIMGDMFFKTNRLDPNAKLFLNDYGIVSYSESAYAIVKSAKQLQSVNAPLYGIGVQSHLQGMPDIGRIMTRLSVVSEAGLPIWITELDVELANIPLRAQAYEDIYRLYFSWPEVEGILLWGFWDREHWRPNAALVQGPPNLMVANEAGRRVFNLIKNEWMTSADIYPSGNQERFEVRGFHGDYTARLVQNGNVIGETTFTLEKGSDVTVTLRPNKD